MIVKNIKSNNGNEVANQFHIIDDNGIEYFQSYQSIIAKKDKLGNVTLDKNYWNFSKTTGKYRNIFLNESKHETEKKINNNTYKLDNLN